MISEDIFCKSSFAAQQEYTIIYYKGSADYRGGSVENPKGSGNGDYRD